MKDLIVTFLEWARKPRAIFWALGAGLLAGLLLALLPSEYAPAAEIICALLLYFSVIILGPLPGIAALWTFALPLLALADNHSWPPFLRLLFLAGLLAFQRLDASMFPPFLVLAVGWFIYDTAYALLTFHSGPNVLIAESPLLLTVFEVSLAILLRLLSCSYRLNRFLGKRVEVVTTVDFFAHLLALPLILSGACFVLLAFFFRPVLLEQLILLAPLPALSVFLLALSIAAAAGSAAAPFIDGLFYALTATAVKDSNIFLAPPKFVPLAAFEPAIDALSKRAGDLEKTRTLVKELTLEVAGKQREVQELHLSLSNLRLLLDNAPEGCVAVRLDGSIIAVNKVLLQIVGLSEDDFLPGEEYTVLHKSRQEWAKEIVDLISWASWKYESILNRGPQRYWSTSANGECLEMVAEARRIAPQKSSHEQKERAQEVVIFVFVRQIADLRALQLRLLEFNPLTHLGSACHEATAKVCEYLDNLNEHLAVLQAKAGSAGRDLLPLLTTSQELAETARRSISDLRDTARPNKREKERVNLSLLVEQGVRYLSQLSPMKGKVKVVTETDREKIAAPGAEERIPFAPTDFVQISYPGEEVSYLLVCLLSSIHALLSKTKTLVVSLDYELIGSSTADMITGSPPGRYARIVMRHDGQSVSSYLHTSARQLLEQRANPWKDAEAGLFLLKAQVKRMGGFFSIQSSNTRGTVITMYLPSEAEQQQTPGKRKHYRNWEDDRIEAAPDGPAAAQSSPSDDQSENASARVGSEKPEESKTQPQSGGAVMVISGDEKTRAFFEQLFRRQGCRVRAGDADSLVNMARVRLELDDEDGKASSAPLSEQDWAKCADELFLGGVVRMLVFDMESANKAIRPLISFLTKEAPHLQKALVLPRGGQPNPGWIPLYRPLDEREVSELLGFQE